MEPYLTLMDWAHLRPQVPAWAVAVALAVIIAALAYCTWTDIKEMLILNKVTYPLIACGLILSPVFFEDWPVHWISGFSCLIVFYAIASIKKDGQYIMGMGDVKLYTAAGFILGMGVVYCLLFASFIGAIHGLAAGKRGQRIAHGPHIALAMVIVLAAPFVL